MQHSSLKEKYWLQATSREYEHLIQSCVRENLSHFLTEIFVKAQLYVLKLFLNVYVTHNLKEIILYLTVELQLFSLRQNNVHFTCNENIQFEFFFKSIPTIQNGLTIFVFDFFCLGLSS